MSTTTVETFSDILQDLSRLSDNFAPSGNLVYCYGSNEAEEWIPISGQDDWRNNSRLLAACIEECKARGWEVYIESDLYADEDKPRMMWYVEIESGCTHPARAAEIDTPALALATALRDALRAEVPA